MFSDENKAASLAKFLCGNDYVIVDTCSLMEESFPIWLDSLDAAKDYLREGFEIQVPEACVNELKKHSKATDDDDRRIEAIRGLKILKEAKKRKLLTIGKTANQNFADNVIYSQVSQDRITKKILVITQDKKLATDLRNLNHLNSQHGKEVSVWKVTPSGELAINHGETYQRSDDNRDSRPYNRGAKSRPAQEKQPGYNKPLHPTRKVEPDEVVKNVLAGDHRLNANLKNPNYPVSSKIEDLKAQLELLRKLPSDKRNGLRLLQSETKMEQSLKILSEGHPEEANKTASTSPAKSEETKPSAVPATEGKAPAKEEPAPQSKPIEAKHQESKPVENKPMPASISSKKAESMPTILVHRPPKKLWSEEANTLVGAVSRVASRYGLMFRDPSISYVPVVHGPIDLTAVNLNEIVSKLNDKLRSSGKAEVNYMTFEVIAEKESRGYKAWLDLNPEPLVEPEAAPKEAKQATAPAAPKEETPKPEEKKPASPKPRKKAEPKEEPKPEVTSNKPVATATSAVPQGVSLVVGVPDDSKRRDNIERYVRRTSDADKPAQKAADEAKKPARRGRPPKAKPAEGATPAETKTPKVKKPVAKKAEAAAPAEPKKPATKRATAKKAEPKPEPKTEAKQETKPAKANSAKSKATKKATEAAPKASAPKKPEASQSDLDQALAAEKRLQANFNNPKYSVANKKRDIEAQKLAVSKLTAAERRKLKFNSSKLDEMLASLA